MYLYKLTTDIFFPDRIYILPDREVSDPLKYFSGNNISCWVHKNDEEVIDNENEHEKDIL
jgi:hypothetical protein